MYELIKAAAKLELFSGNGMRQTPFGSIYRPIFYFQDAETNISGQISLINGDMFYPGMSDVVEVVFIKGMISDKYFAKGEQFTFGESPTALGKGEIIEVLSI